MRTRSGRLAATSEVRCARTNSRHELTTATAVRATDNRNVTGVRRLFRGRRHRHQVALQTRWHPWHLATARHPGRRVADVPAAAVVALRGGAAATHLLMAATIQRANAAGGPRNPVRRQHRAGGRGRCGDSASGRSAGEAGQPAAHRRVHRRGGVPVAVCVLGVWRGCSSPSAGWMPSRSRGNGGCSPRRAGGPRRRAHRLPGRRRAGDDRRAPRQLLELLRLTAGLIVALVATFGWEPARMHYQWLMFAPLPLMLWGGSLGAGGLGLHLLAVALVTLLPTRAGRGPFVAGLPPRSCWRCRASSSPSPSR